MPLSVRMEPMLEHELEMAAKRRGITKSQFIIEAVERALGRVDSRELLREVKARYAPLIAAERRAAYAAGRRPAPNEPLTTGERVRQVLRAKRDASLAEQVQAKPRKTAKRGRAAK
jgi:hypothetical protein